MLYIINKILPIKYFIRNTGQEFLNLQKMITTRSYQYLQRTE